MNHDERWMQEALSCAAYAGTCGEVPIGAVLVKDARLIARSQNGCIARHDPCAHAEVLTLRAAGQVLHNYRLLDTTLYVTLEPCLMCLGAMMHARIARCVFGAWDPKRGALSCHPEVKVPFVIKGGVLEMASVELLQTFFQQRR